jgi:hypothetical protein
MNCCDNAVALQAFVTGQQPEKVRLLSIFTYPAGVWQTEAASLCCTSAIVYSGILKFPLH